MRETPPCGSGERERGDGGGEQRSPAATGPEPALLAPPGARRDGRRGRRSPNPTIASPRAFAAGGVLVAALGASVRQRLPQAQPASPSARAAATESAAPVAVSGALSAHGVGGGSRRLRRGPALPRARRRRPTSTPASLPGSRPRHSTRTPISRSSAPSTTAAAARPGSAARSSRLARPRQSHQRCSNGRGSAGSNFRSMPRFGRGAATVRPRLTSRASRGRPARRRVIRSRPSVWRPRRAATSPPRSAPTGRRCRASSRWATSRPTDGRGRSPTARRRRSASSRSEARSA